MKYLFLLLLLYSCLNTEFTHKRCIGDQKLNINTKVQIIGGCYKDQIGKISSIVSVFHYDRFNNCEEVVYIVVINNRFGIMVPSNNLKIIK